jgi:hypothetical protein
MCCFSKEVESVSNTQICVLPSTLNGADCQTVVYSCEVSMKRGGKQTAMILPAFNPGNNPDNILLHDMSDCRYFFTDLDRLIQKPTYKSAVMQTNSWSESSAPLKVKQVGAYKVSVAPSLQDLKRIDQSVLPINLDLLKEFDKRYSAEHSYVVAAFDPDGPQSAEFSPFAYTHLKSPLGWFVPTLHFHSSKMQPAEEFDHTIYLCNSVVPAAPLELNWKSQLRKLCNRAKPSIPLVEALALDTFGKFEMHGFYENTDLHLPDSTQVDAREHDFTETLEAMRRKKSFPERMFQSMMPYRFNFSW